MSTFDDDEALFEDLYENDSQKETKPSTEGVEPGSAPTQQVKDQNNAGNQPSATPTNPPPAETSASDTLNEYQGGDSIEGNSVTVPTAQHSLGATSEQPNEPLGSPQAGFQEATPVPLQSQQQQFQAYGQQPQEQLSQGQQGQYGQHAQYGQLSYGQQPQQQYGQQPLSQYGQQQQSNGQQTYNPQPPSNLGRDSGKMFIGGLNWDTTEDGMVAYFSKYGEILDYTIMKDPASGRSRGFGFLTFKDPRAVDEVIRKDHILDGKLIDPKRAIAREEQDKVGKIFVGGIDPLVNEKDFNDFFSQFGRIIDAQLMIDKDTGRSRGFGFITYDSPEAVDKVCQNKYLTLKGKAMEVKRAEPRGQHQQNQNQQHQRQQQNQYNNPYANPYGQYQMQFGQPQPNFAGATPEMMQEYWQRMQWYMFQQQQAGMSAQPNNDAAVNDQPEQQPLNPQQQAPKEEASQEDNSSSSNSRPAIKLPEGPKAASRPDGPRQGARRGRVDSDSDSASRRLNLPKGPRKGASASSSGGGYKGGRGAYKKGEFHPYGRGSRR